MAGPWLAGRLAGWLAGVAGWPGMAGWPGWPGGRVGRMAGMAGVAMPGWPGGRGCRVAGWVAGMAGRPVWWLGLAGQVIVYRRLGCHPLANQGDWLFVHSVEVATLQASQ